MTFLLTDLSQGVEKRPQRIGELCVNRRYPISPPERRFSTQSNPLKEKSSKDQHNIENDPK